MLLPKQYTWYGTAHYGGWLLSCLLYTAEWIFLVEISLKHALKVVFVYGKALGWQWRAIFLFCICIKSISYKVYGQQRYDV